MITLRHAIVLALLVALAFVIGRVLMPTPVEKPAPQWTPAPVAPQLQSVEQVTIAPPAIKVYAPIAKRKLNLPPAVQADEHSYVLDAARLPADYHPLTVTTLIDEQTGETQTLVREEPMPWLDATKRGAARLDYGIKNGGTRVARISIEQDVLAIKAARLGVSATLDSDGKLFAGAGVGVSW